MIRAARMADAQEIRRIYNYEVEHTTHTFDLVPRTLKQQRMWLRSREGALGVLVAELDGKVVGFASLSEYRARPAYRTSVESSVYVHRDCRQQGVGHQLLGALGELAARRGFHTMLARIAGGHDASIRLHAKAGYEVVGTEREVGRKFGNWLDVVLMQRMLQ